MKFFNNKALGIYVSAETIELALLKKLEGGIELVKSASCPVPEGAIKEGGIEKPALLAKAVRTLRRKKGLYATKAALALFTKPFLMQIIDMPGQLPSNISHFIETEVKNCVVLPSREIVFDFCKIGARKQGAENRLFVVAADRDKFIEVARAFTKYGFNIQAIEPGFSAGVRTFFNKKIVGKFDCNVMLFMVDGNDFTVCVFRNQALDFVRTGSIYDCRGQTKELSGRIASQINTIKQFYEIDVPESSGDWEITVVANDTAGLGPDAETLLQKHTSCEALKVVTSANMLGDTNIVFKEKQTLSEAGPEAIGMALRFLNSQKNELKINLLPEKVVQMLTLKKDVLISANIVAALFMILFIVVGWLAFAVGQTGTKIDHARRMNIVQKTRFIYDEKARLANEIKDLQSKCRQMNAVLNTRSEFEWSNILEEIRKATPKSVRITTLGFDKNKKLLMEGTALSYDVVYLFVDMLNKSKFIKSASLIETEKMSGKDELIRYAVECFLVEVKEEI
jgi:Tfp pilus assembly protein PilN